MTVGTRYSLLEKLARRPTTPASTIALWGIFAVELVGVGVSQLPDDLSFNAFAFADRGSWLTVQYLSAHGYAPGIDFGFNYGLLPILVGSAWFRIFGLTPVAYQLAMAVCGLLMAWAIARVAVSMHLNLIGMALLITALPFAIRSSYPSLAHALEAVLICTAIAEHAAARRSTALALITAACLCKPSMGYVYGFVLLLFIVWHQQRTDTANGRHFQWRQFLRTLIPATVTGLMLLIVLAAVYGARPLLTTILPLSGINVYKIQHFGFFHGWGREFWYGLTPGAYVATVVGFWLFASVWLVAAGLFAMWKLTRHPEDTGAHSAELVASCAFLHVAFVTSFFGGPMTWSYYSYILVIGVALTCTWSPAAARIAAALAFSALLGHLAVGVTTINEWKTMTPHRDTAGLWSMQSDRAEWMQVQRAIRGADAVLISAQGCAALLFRDFEEPVAIYALPGATPKRAIDHILRQANAAQMVVAPLPQGIGAALKIPEIRKLVDQRIPVVQNSTFGVYRRIAPQ